MGGTASRSSGLTEQTPPAAKRVRTKNSVSWEDENNEGTARDVNMGIAVPKGLSAEERDMARALPAFTAKAISSRLQTGWVPPRVPMKAPPTVSSRDWK